MCDARQGMNEPRQIERRIAGRLHRFGAHRHRQTKTGEECSNSEGPERPAGEINSLHGSFPCPGLSAALGVRLGLFGCRDHEIGQQSTYAIMDMGSHVKFFCRRVQIEGPVVGPHLHDSEAVE